MPYFILLLHYSNFPDLTGAIFYHNTAIYQHPWLDGWKILNQSETRAAILSFWSAWKNINLVEDVGMLLPVRFCLILFSGFRGEVENVWANQRPERQSTVYRNFRVGQFLRNWRLDGVLIFHWVLFSLFQGLSVKTYSRVYFSLCLFLAISRRSRTQQKLNPREKFPIYGILIATSYHVRE